MIKFLSVLFSPLSRTSGSERIHSARNIQFTAKLVHTATLRLARREQRIQLVLLGVQGTRFDPQYQKKQTSGGSNNTVRICAQEGKKKKEQREKNMGFIISHLDLLGLNTEFNICLIHLLQTITSSIKYRKSLEIMMKTIFHVYSNL